MTDYMASGGVKRGRGKRMAPACLAFLAASVCLWGCDRRPGGGSDAGDAGRDGASSSRNPSAVLAIRRARAPTWGHA
jgi:hypothetical protein